MAGALAAYRILDVTDEKGMLCGRFLAEMGAEVIMVEKTSAACERQSPSFCHLNAGKKSIILDIESDKGRDIFKRLIATADVLIESGAPGHFESIGLGYSRVSQINPGLVMASITDFGQDGPYRNYKSCNMVTAALGGQVYISGEPDTAPLKPHGNQAYNSACLFAAIGIMLALWNRHSTGGGQYLDISAMECVAATLDHVLPRYFSEGVVAGRQGSLYWNKSFRVFRCRDGYILLSLFQNWETMVEWLDSEGMAEDLNEKKWQDREERLSHIDHIIGVLERWTSRHKADELVKKGQLMRFPWAKVNTISELLQNPQLAERRYFADAECFGKKYKYAGLSGLGVSPGQERKVTAPGENNFEIYSQLGLSEEDIQKTGKDDSKVK